MEELKDSRHKRKKMGKRTEAKKNKAKRKKNKGKEIELAPTNLTGVSS